MRANFHPPLMLENHIPTIAQEPGLNPSNIAVTTVESLTLATQKRN